jgi:hypothetical protein
MGMPTSHPFSVLLQILHYIRVIFPFSTCKIKVIFICCVSKANIIVLTPYLHLRELFKGEKTGIWKNNISRSEGILLI